MSRYDLLLTLKVFAAAACLVFLGTASDMTTSFRKTGRVDEISLAQSVASPRIYAFDLSPSGQTIALWVRSGDLVNAPTWLLMVDAKTGQILRKTNAEDLRLDWKLLAYFPPQIFFTPDAKLLVVREEAQVRIVDAVTLNTVRTIEAPKTMVPVSICGSEKSDVFAISFARDWQRQSELERLPVRVEIIDVSDGTRRGGWDADDIPQSLSPDAKLAAVSDHSMGEELLKLDVVDTNSGKNLAVLDGGFKFEKTEAGQTIGRVVGRFLSDEEILLSPDSKFDRSGQHSGDSLRIAHVPDGKIVQVLKPDRFGPTGEIRSSANGEEIIAASWYLKPDLLTHPHEPMPAGSAPELLVFSGRREFRLEGIIKSTGGGLRVGGSALPFRISSDGSVIAIAEDHGITVFEKPG